MDVVDRARRGGRVPVKRFAFLQRLRAPVERYGLVLAVALALVLRIIAHLGMGIDTPPEGQSAGADAINYAEAAASLAAGDGYLLYGEDSALRPPGYPMLVSIFYRLFGPDHRLGKLVNLLLGLGTVVLVWQIARVLRLNRLYAALAACSVAALPMQLLTNTKFMSETTAGFFITLTTLLLLLAQRSYQQCQTLWPAIGWIALAGLANGYSVLTRPNALLLLPAYGGLIGLIALRHAWQRRRAEAAEPLTIAPFRLPAAILCVLVLTICTFAVILPWSLRNHRVFNEFVLVSTVGGITCWGANNAHVASPNSREWGSWSWTEVPAAEREAIIHLPEPQRDKLAFAGARRFIRENPSQWLPLAIGKAYRLISPFPIADNAILVLIVGLPGLLLQGFSLAGLIMICNRPERIRRWAPLLGFLIVVLGTTVIFYSSPRFRAPTEPLQAIVAVLAVGGLLRRWLGPPETPPPA